MTRPAAQDSSRGGLFYMGSGAGTGAAGFRCTRARLVRYLFDFIKLLKRADLVCRRRGMSGRTAQAYCHWILRFLTYSACAHGQWLPPERLGTADVEAFLNHLVGEAPPGRRRCRAGPGMRSGEADRILPGRRSAGTRSAGDFGLLRRVEAARPPVIAPAPPPDPDRPTRPDEPKSRSSTRPAWHAGGSFVAGD